MLFQNCVSGEIQFYQKSLTHKEKQHHTVLPQQELEQQNQIITTAPHEKGSKILKCGPPGYKSSPNQNERLSNAL